MDILSLNNHGLHDHGKHPLSESSLICPECSCVVLTNVPLDNVTWMVMPYGNGLDLPQAVTALPEN